MSRLQEQRAAGRPAVAPADVAVVGAGYVGLPLAQTFAEAGRSVVLVDAVVERAQLVVDFRNATRGIAAEDGKVWTL